MADPGYYAADEPVTTQRCAFGDDARGYCNARATEHVWVTGTASGDGHTMTCGDHVAEVAATWPVRDWHPVVGPCGLPGTHWIDSHPVGGHGWCEMEEPDWLSAAEASAPPPARVAAGTPTTEAPTAEPAAAKVEIDRALDEPLAPDWGGEETDEGTPIYHAAWDSKDGQARVWAGPYSGGLNDGWALTVSDERVDVVLRCTADQLIEWADCVRDAIVQSRQAAGQDRDS